MKRLIDRFLSRRGRSAIPAGCSFPNLTESIAYSAFLASGAEDAETMSFAQFRAPQDMDSQSSPSRETLSSPISFCTT
jgi:hypothetical protein